MQHPRDAHFYCSFFTNEETDSEGKRSTREHRGPRSRAIRISVLLGPRPLAPSSVPNAGRSSMGFPRLCPPLPNHLPMMVVVSPEQPLWKAGSLTCRTGAWGPCFWCVSGHSSVAAGGSASCGNRAAERPSGLGARKWSIRIGFLTCVFLHRRGCRLGELATSLNVQKLKL